MTKGSNMFFNLVLSSTYNYNIQGNWFQYF